jgi:hypothetical protein
MLGIFRKQKPPDSRGFAARMTRDSTTGALDQIHGECYGSRRRQADAQSEQGGASKMLREA